VVLNVRRLTQSCLVAAAFVSSWNAVQLRGIQPVDIFLALAVGLSLISLTSGRVPWVPRWVKAGTFCVLLVMVSHLVAPTDATYMSQRFIYVPWFVRITGVDLTASGIFNGAKWLLALTVLPVIVADVAKDDPGFVKRISTAWLAGATVSAFIAITDLLGLTSVNTLLIVIGAATARQAGLTSHPNHLGMSVSIVAPLAIALAMRSRRAGVGVLMLLMGGAIVSGSRAGQAGFVLAVTATLALSARARRFVPILIVAAGISAAGIVWAKPGLVDTIATLFRFDTTDKYVAQSNEERASLSTQAVADFAHRPVDGVGLDVLAQAHNIYLQIAASGGLVLACGMFAYFAGMLSAAYAERRNEDPLGLYLLVSVSVWLASATFGTQLTDRYLYFPVAAIAALQGQRIRLARKQRQMVRQTAAAASARLNEQPLLS
jgi:hypothetical protein